MEFQTQYNRKSRIPEKNTLPSMTERAGYIPAEKRIENMMLAGQRLAQSRKDQYDFEDDNVDESFEDPTRTVGFDDADASQIALALDAEMAYKASQRAQVEPKIEKPVEVPPAEK